MTAVNTPARCLHRAAAAGERGYITLVTALIIILGITLMTLFSGKVAVTEVGVSSNEVRTKEAQAAAEEGVERLISHIDKNRALLFSSAGWSACASGDTAVPCGDGENNLFPDHYSGNWIRYTVNNAAIPCAGNRCLGNFLVTLDSGSGAPYQDMILIATVQAQSDDRSARAVVREAIKISTQASGPAVDAPLVTPGIISGSGTFDVVANPNSAGRQGTPLSAWANSNVTFGGTSKSCQLGNFLGSVNSLLDPSDVDYVQKTCTFEGVTSPFLECQDCFCTNDAAMTLGQASYDGIDILDKDGGTGANPDTDNFPADLFEYLFNVPISEYQAAKDYAQSNGKLITNCSDLNTVSSGFHWKVGDCDFSYNVGAVETPVLLVVQDGATRANNNFQFYGLIFSFKTSGTGTAEVHLTGGPTVTGAIISNVDIDLGNGNFVARYDLCVLSKIAQIARLGNLPKLPGSWADFALDL